MSTATWKSLSTLSKVEDVITFLTKADVGSVIFSMDEMIVKDALFDCMKKFPTNAEVQRRSIQHLQDCQLLSQKGITNEELAFRFDTLLQSLSSYMDRTDVICNLFEFLAMVADRKSVKERCSRTEENELLQYVGQALELHQKDKAVQRAGLQLYEAILMHASEKSQRHFAKKIFRAVGENLQKNNDDPAICFSSYSILCTLTDKMGDKLAPWIERILSMILTTVSQLFSPELVAKCMTLLEHMATDEESLYVMAAHPRCLLVFTDALGILGVSYLGACITALEYLLRILEDDTAMHIVAENLHDQNALELQYYASLQAEFLTKTDRFIKLVEQTQDVDAGAMEYWQQLVDAIKSIVEELVQERQLQAGVAPAATVSVPVTNSIPPLEKTDTSVTALSTTSTNVEETNVTTNQANANTNSNSMYISADNSVHDPSHPSSPSPLEDTNSKKVFPHLKSEERMGGFNPMLQVNTSMRKSSKNLLAAAAVKPVVVSEQSEMDEGEEEEESEEEEEDTGNRSGRGRAQTVIASAASLPSTSAHGSLLGSSMHGGSVHGSARIQGVPGSVLPSNSHVTWETLGEQTDAFVAGAFLHSADVGLAAMTQQVDPMVMKGALFDTMLNFEADAEILHRCVQLLQDCHILLPKGITNDELAFRFDQLLQLLEAGLVRADLVCVLFEFFAMVADRKSVKERCARTEKHELLQYVGQALEIHRADKAVQRAGLQLYEAILLHATEKSQKHFAKKIFKTVGENLQKNNDDPAICFSSYSILCTLTDKMGDKLAPWIERILGLILTTITQLFSAELVAKCLLLLEKIAVDHDSLFVMAAHPRCLLVFTDALGILDPKFMSATITALEYLLRILEDDTSMSVVLENLDEQKITHLEYFQQVQSELAAKSDKFLDLTAQAGEVDDGAMQYWLQLLEQINNILVEFMRELNKEAAEIIQAAVTPGLLPTIEEHEKEHEGYSSEESDVEVYNEKEDDSLGHISSPMMRAMRKAESRAARLAVDPAASFSSDNKVGLNDGAFSTEDTLTAEQEEWMAHEVENMRVAEEEASAEQARRLVEEEAELQMAYHSAQDASDAEAESRLLEQAAAEAALETKRLLHEAEEQEVYRVAQVAAEAEEARVAAEEEALRLAQAEAAAEALRLEQEAAEQEANRVSQDAALAEEARLAAEEEAFRAAQAEAEAEALRLSLEAEAQEQLRQLQLAAAEEETRLIAEEEAYRVAQAEAEEEAQRLADEAEEAEAYRIAQAAAEAEAEEFRLAEEAEQARLAQEVAEEEEREAYRIAQAEAEAEAEAYRLEQEAEQERVAWEEAEAQRLQDEADQESYRVAQAAAEAEEQQLLEELEAQRLAQEAADAEALRIAEEEEQEAQRIALAEAEAEALRVAEEEAEEAYRIAQAEAEAEELRLAEEEETRRATEAAAEEKRLQEEAEAFRLAQERDAAEAERLLAAQRARLAAAAAAAEKAEADKQAALTLKREREAEAVRLENERRATEKARAAAAAAKAEEDRLAALRLHQELQKQREVETAKLEAQRKAAIEAQRARVAAAAAAAEKAEADRQAALLLKQERELEAARHEAERRAVLEAEKEKAAALAHQQRNKEAEAERAKRERKAFLDAEAVRIAEARKAERERIAAQKREEAERLEAERKEARELRARVWEIERAEKQRAAELRKEELERQIAARRAAEAELREQANVIAAEKKAATMAAAKLAAEKAAARVAAEKEAERERAAQRLAEREARLAAAEQTKIALLAQRKARLEQERQDAEIAAVRREAEQRERDERAAEEKAMRQAAMQLALLEAQQKTQREREAAQREHAKEIARLEAVRREAEQEQQAAQKAIQQASVEHKPTSSPKNSSSFNVANDIANEDVHVAVAPSTESTAVPLERNRSWKSDKVPFLRKSEQVAAKLTTLETSFPVAESAELIALRQEAEASRRQAAEALEKLNALQELHQTAEKKAEGLLSANTKLLQMVNEGSFSPAVTFVDTPTTVPFASTSTTTGAAGATTSAAPTGQTGSSAPRTASPLKGYSSVLLGKPGKQRAGAGAAVPSLSPVRAAPPTNVRTPKSQLGSARSGSGSGDGSNNGVDSRMGTAQSAQSTQSLPSGYFEMDSVAFDLTSPSPRQQNQPSPRKLSHSSSAPKLSVSAPTSAGSQQPPKQQPMQQKSQKAQKAPPQSVTSVVTPSTISTFSPAPPRAESPQTNPSDTTLSSTPNRAKRAAMLKSIHYPKGRVSPSRRSSLKAPEDSESKQSQAIGGILEAFAQLTVPSTKVLHINYVPRASLHSDSPPGSASSRGDTSLGGSTSRGSQSPQRRSLLQMETMYNEVVAESQEELMLECGNNVAALFRRLKESNKSHQDAGKLDSVVPLPLVKACVKKLGLLEEPGFGVNEAHIVLSSLGVKQLTLFGFAYAITACAERFMTCALNADSAVSVPLESYLAVVDVLNDKVIRHLERVDADLQQRRTFNPLDDYKEISQEEQVEVMKLLEREKKVFFTIYKSYLPSAAQGFSDIKIALTAVPFSGGLPFSGVVNFCRDFEVSPEMLSRPQLLELFESVLQAERELIEHTVNVLSDAGKMDTTHSALNGTKSFDSTTKLADAKSDSISFPQFLDLILLIALRCPMFRGPSPAVIKLSNLLLLLNRSKGKTKIEQKFRWKELVVFRANPVFAVAARVENNTQKAVTHIAEVHAHEHSHGHALQHSLDEELGVAHETGEEKSTSTMASHSNETDIHGHQLPPSKIAETWNGLPASPPQAGLIAVSPRSQRKKPTTVPYYDVETQAVVQIRRKKPMDELRNRFGEPY